MRRVYYSAYSPIPSASARLPAHAPPLLREHRLYQADWLLRHYGFTAEEIVPENRGDLDLDVDPKLAWALAHRDRFPVDVNRADREMLLRVPGFGTRTVKRIVAARKVRAVRSDDLARLRVPLAKVLPFVVLSDHHPNGTIDSEGLDTSVRAEQLALFD